MALKSFEELKQRLKAGRKKAIVLVCAHDEHATQKGMEEYIRVGNAPRIEAMAKEFGIGSTFLLYSGIQR